MAAQFLPRLFLASAKRQTGAERAPVAEQFLMLLPKITNWRSGP
jgi:hypothetical protein